jgi:CHAD domain-containing protein
LKRYLTKAGRLRRKVQEGDDPEALHDLRVAVRRARRVVQAFEAFIPPTVGHCEEALHGLFHTLGAVRDLDVALEKWSALSGLAADGVTDRLRAERSVAKAELATSLGCGSVLDELRVAMSAETEEAVPLAAVPIEAAAPDLLEEVYQRAKRAEKRMGEDATPNEIHQLRRRVKRLRDELELLAPFYRPQGKQMARELKRVQNLLGAYQDLIMVQGKLEVLVRESGVEREASKRVLDGIGQECVELRQKILAESSSIGAVPWSHLRRRMRADRRKLWKPVP